MKKLLIALFLVMLPSICWSGTYYVTGSGGGTTWANCTNISTPCTLATANANANFGDTVYLLDAGGTYSTGIAPVNSGTSGNPIIFSNYNDSVVTISPPVNVSCLDLSGRSYVKVTGSSAANITFNFYFTGSTTSYLMNLANGSSYNEVAYCVFDGGSTSASSRSSAAGSINIRDLTGNTAPSSNNWIHHNTFRNQMFWSSTCSTNSMGLNMGWTTGTGDIVSKNNTIEYNVWHNLSHHCIETSTKQNVIRGNVFHNEGYLNDPGGCVWPASARNSKYGDRNMQIYDGFSQGTMHNLLENNRTGHAAMMVGGQEGNMTITSHGNIIRYNYSYYSETFGLAFKIGASSDGINNRAYNNTLYYNGQDSRDNSPGQATDWRGGVGCHPSSTNTNILKNNIIYGSYLDRDIMNTSNYSCTGRITDTNNWKTSTGNPQFSDTDVSDPTSLTKPNLTPLNASVRDGGTYLTTVSAVTDQTHITLADAIYFQAGSEPTCGGATKTTPVGSCLSNIQADFIAIGTVGNTVQISDINYTTGAVTLASTPGSTVSVGQSVWLYKKSDGVQVLYGTAPDYGAHEYISSTPPSATGCTISGGSFR